MDAPQELVIATFDTEKAAHEAQKALKSWSKATNMKVINSAVLEKDSKGKTTVHQDQDVSAGTGTVFGALVGGLVGLLGGPGGVVVGAAAGAVTGGATAATVNFGFSNDEISAIRATLPASSSALISVVEDRWAKDMMKELNRHSQHVWHRHLPEDFWEGVPEP